MTTDRLHDLQDFTLQSLQRLGALVEHTETGRAEALLPDFLAERLQAHELLQLTFQAGNLETGVERVAYGSPFLERLFETVEETLVPIAGIELRDGAHASAESAKRFALDNLALQNVTLRALHCTPARGRLLLVTYRYQAQCDDTADGLINVALEAGTGALVHGEERLRDLCRNPETFCLPRSSGLESPAERATARRTAETRVTRQLEEFRTAIARYRQQDGRRLHEYYGELLEDLRDSPRRAMEGDPERLAKKHQAILADYAVKCRELELRSKIQVVIRPTAILEIRIPAFAMELELLRRKKNVTAHIRYIPALRELLGPLCQHCSKRCRPLWCCDEGHILCGRPGCYAPCRDCERKSCPRCVKGERCPKCGAPRGGVGDQASGSGASQALARGGGRSASPEVAGPVEVGGRAGPRGGAAAAGGGVEGGGSRAAAGESVALRGGSAVPKKGGTGKVVASTGKRRSPSKTPRGPSEPLRADSATGDAGRLLELLQARATLRPAEVREFFGWSPGELRKIVGILRKSGKLKVRGRGRGTLYLLPGGSEGLT